MEKMSKKSQEFLERKELLDLKREIQKEKHQQDMAELMFQRKSQELYHEQALTRMRIKSAEIKKAELRRSFNN